MSSMPQRKNYLKRGFRLAGEFFYALVSYKNPFSYLWERWRDYKGYFLSGTFILQLRNGIQYRLRQGANQARTVDEIWRLKVYDRLLSSVKDGSTVIDIGANIGIFSVKAARFASGVKVFSYEPAPHNFQFLTTNVALNNLQGAVRSFSMAVGGRVGTVEFFFSHADSGGGSFYNYQKGLDEKITVHCTTLADIFKENHIEQCDFLKIDCEGAEGELLFNAPRELFSRIRTITLEWHDFVGNKTLSELMKFLEEQGYRVDYQPQGSLVYAEKI